MDDASVFVRDNQLVGNVGLYYICYELSRLGWNVLPTSRNARGIASLFIVEMPNASILYTN